MNYFRSLGLAAVASLALSQASRAADAGPDPAQISISVGKLLEQGQYLRKKLDDETSRQFLKNYLDALDYNHMFFTQQDVDTFSTKYAAALDDDILLGNPAPAYDIFDVYKKRVEARVADVKEMLKVGKFEFTTEESIERDRTKAAWPKDDAEADELWRKLVKGEFLQEKLSDHAVDPPVKALTRRYDQLLRNLTEQTPNEVVSLFLTTLAQTYDPHSEYLNREELDNFQINMRLSLFGIGAQLRSEDGYVKVMELIPGGPAQMDGHLKVNDRIMGVAQGEEPFADVMGMKLDKVVDLIRGKKGTKVRLQVAPGRATDPSARKIIQIVRDEVKMKNQHASAKVIERTNSAGVTEKLGWITLPAFYQDMDNPGKKDATSTSRDVLALVNRLKKENVSGLIMDLRRNGGGSLDEAIKLTGLFIKKGPVVQTKDGNGNIIVSSDKDPDVAYEGPMLVLTNRLSASASEIFAAALQDYGRAVIVGDQSTFGKGTVQTMLEIGRFIPFLGADSNAAGALKLTIQKFYRIAGGSTQLHGVTADVHLPSIYDHADIGESALKGPMPYDEVPPAKYQKVQDHPLFLKDLAARSSVRVAADPEFRYVEQDLALLEKKLGENRISLNEKDRRAEIASDKARKDKRTADRAKRAATTDKVYALTLETIDAPQLQLVNNEVKKEKTTTPGDAPKASASLKKADGSKPAADTAKAEASPQETPAEVDDDEAADDDTETGKGPMVDAVRNEGLNILSDLIELSRTLKTASVK